MELLSAPDYRLSLFGQREAYFSPVALDIRALNIAVFCKLFDIDGDEIRLYLSDIDYVACSAVIRVVREKHQDIKRRLRYVQLTAERLADCVIRRRKFLREVYSHVHAIISLQI